MEIKVKCPVCNAGNSLTYRQLQCRRCKEDLSMLYGIKAYSYKYRLYLLQMLGRTDIKKQRVVASAATKLLKVKD